MSPSPLLQRDAAVEADGLDAGVAAHYGDPIREQRLLESGEAMVDLSNRGVVTVTGPDRLTWLHSMTTQKLDDLQPGVSVESLVLSPHGHVEHDLHLVDDGETTWITVEPGTCETLVEWLRKMQFMLRVEVADRSADFAVLGDPSTDPVEGLVWVDPWPTPGPDTANYSDVDPHPALGRAWRELIVPRDEMEARVADRPLAGTWAMEALRVAHWRPRHLADTDHRAIPHELDWLRTAVHLHKGCYRGQETIARVHNLGRPPRRLVFLHLDGSGHVLPDAGADLFAPASERAIGRLTSVVRHHEDGPIALAVVKRNVPIDAVLRAGDVTAAQTEIVKP
ncbi:folate-binding protein YgfZ [Yimella sp. cx-573]|nr:folate-binding protein YgfZ [Yimella sp. cx-573]